MCGGLGGNSCIMQAGVQVLCINQVQVLRGACLLCAYNSSAMSHHVTGG